MKKLLVVLVICLAGSVSSFTPSPVSFEKIVGPFEDVVAALKKGDVSGLSRYLDTDVEINISGKADSYTKTQAETLLKDFFAKNAVKSFEIIHQGEGGAGSRFATGNLVTSNGNYRTSFFLQKKGGAMLLNELRFESK